MNASNSGTGIRWAFNSATIMHCPWEEELKLWEEFGWRAAEVWYAKMEPQLTAGATLNQLADQMRDAGVSPVGVCAGFAYTSAHRDDEAQEYSALEKMLDVTATIGSPALTTVIIGEPSDDLVLEYSYIADKLHRLAEMAAARGVRINLEFLGDAPINRTLGSGIELVNRVNHPALGLLFDFCHYYVSASHIEELELLPREKLFAVHVDDSPRKPMEQLRSDERCFPGEGRTDVADLIRRLRGEHRYNSYFTVELYDKSIWEMPANEVMQRLSDCLTRLQDHV
jgi:4-hydroxyphenylpyruvate dioxygenase